MEKGFLAWVSSIAKLTAGEVVAIDGKSLRGTRQPGERAIVHMVSAWACANNLVLEQRALFDTGPITNHVNFANNRNGKFAYVTLGGANQVKVFRRGATPELVATIPVGNLPHGIWPSGDGSRVYVALENAAAIDTLTNKVIANIPIGQTTQALV